MTSMPTTEAESSAAKRVNGTKLITVGIIFAAALWFILVNTGKTRVRLWIPTVSAPLWLVLLVTFAGGIAAGLLIRRGKAKSQKQAGQ